MCRIEGCSECSADGTMCRVCSDGRQCEAMKDSSTPVGIIAGMCGEKGAYLVGMLEYCNLVAFICCIDGLNFDGYIL